MRHYARAFVALAAAYAVALQALLLAFGGLGAGAGGLAALPICASLATADPGSPPADRGHDCRVACLTGCCGGTPVMPPRDAATIYAPGSALTLAAAIEAGPALPPHANGAHRSRGPPLA